MLHDASVRAIVFNVAGVTDTQRANLVQKLRREGKTAAQHGALIVLLVDRTHLGLAARIADEVGSYTFAQMVAGGERLTQPQLLVLAKDEVTRAAEAIARHDPGPAENAALTILDMTADASARDEETSSSATNIRKPC